MIFKLVKSKPPIIMEMTGMTTSLTRELTIDVNAPPTIIPTARSTTEPRLMNSLNSLMTFGSFFFKLSRFLEISVVFMRRLYHFIRNKTRRFRKAEPGKCMRRRDSHE